MFFYDLVLETLFPSLCSNCSALVPKGDAFCSVCISQLQMVPTVFFAVNKKISLKVFAAAAYTGPMQQLVLKKFSQQIIASQQMARLMLAFTPIRTYSFDLIVPVPLHWSRYAKRGYNQAYESAKVLGRELAIPVCSLVRRKKRTVYQSTLSSADRKANVIDAFEVSRIRRLLGNSEMSGKHILLVDDLCTTGATLIGVATALADYQPASITAVVGCRAI